LHKKLDERLVRLTLAVLAPVPAPPRKDTMPCAALLAALERGLMDGLRVGVPGRGCALDDDDAGDEMEEALRKLRRSACEGPSRVLQGAERHVGKEPGEAAHLIMTTLRRYGGAAQAAAIGM
jgi:hypothetical protein